MLVGRPVDAGDVPGDVVDPDADQVVPHLLRGVLVRGQEHQRVRVGFRVHDPGAEARHGLAGRDVQGPGHGALVDLVVGPGIDERQRVRGQALRHSGGVQFGQRGAVAHHGRAFTVLPLHPAKVRVRVGLAVEEFIHEALLVVGRQVRAPPGVEPLVTDRGGRDRAQGLAAGTAGTVRRVDLDIIRQGQELIPQAREQLLRTREPGVDPAGGLIQQVRAAQIPGEDKVTREQVPGAGR